MAWHGWHGVAWVAWHGMGGMAWHGMGAWLHGHVMYKRRKMHGESRTV